MKKKKVTELLIFIVATELVGALSGLLAGNSFSFYKELIKPPLSPPGWLFPVMWAILYALMGIWNAAFCEFYVEHCIFQIQNVRIFRCGDSDFAGVDYCIDDYFRKIRPAAAYLNIPYLLWIIFASYLNIGIFLLN